MKNMENNAPVSQGTTHQEILSESNARMNDISSHAPTAPENSSESSEVSTDPSGKSSEVPAQSEEKTPPLENVFKKSQNATPDHKSLEEKSEKLEIDLTSHEFDSPKDFDDAKAQLGRLKPYMAKLKDKLKENSLETPETYKFSLQEELKDKIGIDSKDPLYEGFCDISKTANLTNDQFSEVINFYLSNELKEQNELSHDHDHHVEGILKELGNDDVNAGIKRLNNLTSRLAERGLVTEQIECLQECLSIDKTAILAMENLLNNQIYSNIKDNFDTVNSLQSRYYELKEKMKSVDYQQNSNYKKHVIEQLGKLYQQGQEKGITFQR